MSTSVMWFRKDFRLSDHPALTAAVEAGSDGVVPAVVVDDLDGGGRGSVRRAALAGQVQALSPRVGGVHVIHGDPVVEIPRLAAAVGASSVHVTADLTPGGRRRDDKVSQALDAGTRLVRSGTIYAVEPGLVRKQDGDPYRVFTPFYAQWGQFSGEVPRANHAPVPWIRPADSSSRVHDADAAVNLPSLGEVAAQERWQEFLDHDVDDYDTLRDRPDLDRSSRMSVHLAWGSIHPRTLLRDLGYSTSDGAGAYRRELAFREFYGDVLFHTPTSAYANVRSEYDRFQYDEPDADLDAWKAGRTGIPIVDAGMRQLLAEGWMHNRVRMIVASFLVKDLHLEWQHGARHFMELLADADLASNQHGWQWVAGSGTDAAPYFRVFNPILQGKKFDPDGTYVRRWVPELVTVDRSAIHTPWEMPHPPNDYPLPLVDHADERRESLRRYEVLRRG